MATFVPKKEEMRGSLLFCFRLKKSAIEAHRLLEEAYGEYALSLASCKNWFVKFREGNFDLTDHQRENRPKQFEDAELQVLLDDDPTQSQEQLAQQLGVTQQAISLRLRAMGKIQKIGKWVPHELNDRQQERRRNTSEMLLARNKGKRFLHRIITGDEKWIFFENPKRKESWVSPGQPAASSARPDRFGKKTMLCVWWDQKRIIYYECLKPGETVNAHRYHQQLIKLNQAVHQCRPEYFERHERIILLHDNAPAHASIMVRNYLDALNWELLPHPPYSPDLAPSDYHLFASMGHALSEQHFANYEDVKNWLKEWFDSKLEKFFWDGIHNLPERWAKCVASEGNYFE